MQRFGTLKTRLCAVSLSAFFTLGVASCPTNIPKPPEHWQCQFNGKPRAFYCENSVTFEKIKIPIDSPDMKGAQCLPAPDFILMSRYTDELKALAYERCK
jgi:hypothetical protein